MCVYRCDHIYIYIYIYIYIRTELLSTCIALSLYITTRKLNTNPKGKSSHG